MGAKEAEITSFPREAMAELQPYPFGLDPVSLVVTCHLICMYETH